VVDSWGRSEDKSHALQGGLGKLDIQDQLQSIRWVLLRCERQAPGGGARARATPPGQAVQARDLGTAACHLVGLAEVG
jgi:hypothetical protein